MKRLRATRTIASIAAASAWLVLAAEAGARTFEVTTVADHAPKACTAGDCTLREAIRAANASAGRDRVLLPPSKKPYRLTRQGDSEDKGRTGDLDLDGDGVLIRGKSPKRAVIKQTEADRVLEVTEPTAAFVSLRNVTLRGGDAAASGGGLRTEGLTSLRRVVVRGNRAEPGTGGGIATSGEAAQLRIRQTTIAANVAASTGGGITMTGIDLDSEIEATTISGNAAARGGGIWTNPDQGRLTIVNSTISDNTAVSPDPPTAPATGGGINVVDLANDDVGPDVRLEYTTVAGNESLPGRVANLVSGYAVQLQNTIIAEPIGAVSCGGTQDSHGYNLDEGTSCDLDLATDHENADASLSPLADNGGPTQTRAVGLGSDAISEGDCTPTFVLPGFDLSVDQRGVSRPQTNCDIGAYEFQISFP